MVRFLSDTTGVMKNGKLVEMAPTKELFENPQHPYTQSLLSAIHIPDPLEERKRRLIEYEEPAVSWRGLEKNYPHVTV